MKAGRLLDIVISRAGTASLHNQLVTQISLLIINGLLQPGDKLPSVRALARKLHIHHNTVSAAYGELAESSLVELKRGSGVYVRQRQAANEFSELDHIIREFLETARRKGYSLRTIRDTITKWLERQPPDHLLIVEPAADLQQILIHELASQIDCGIASTTIQEVMAQPEMFTGALVVVTAYHASEVRKLLPSDILPVTINLQTGQAQVKLIKSLPLGSMVALISLGSTLIDYAQVVIASLRGDQLLVRTEHFSSTKQWRALAATADLVITDSYCFEKIKPFARNNIIAIELLSPQIIRYLRANLSASVPA